MRKNNKTYNIVYHNSKKYTKGYKNDIKYFGDGVPATGTVVVTLLGNKNNVTVAISPDKPVYNLGEEVTITVSKPYYTTKTETFNIQEGVNNKTFSMNTYADSRIMYFRFIDSATSSRQIDYGLRLYNRVEDVRADRLGGGFNVITSVDGAKDITVSSSSVTGSINKVFKIQVMGSGYFNPNDYMIERLNFPYSASKTTEILTYGAFSFGSNNTIPLYYTGRFGYIAAPRTFNIVDTSNFFNSGSTNINNYSVADFSDWNGYQLVIAESMFANISSLNLDPRIFDYSLTTNMVNIFQNTVFTDPTMYDNFLIFLSQNYLNKALTFSYGGKYTSAGASARASLIAAGWVINDGGLNAGTLNINTTPADATVIKVPNKVNYDVGEVVNITVSHPDYVTKIINHTIVSGVNTINVVLEEDGYELNITAVGASANTLTVTKTPNKSRYQEGEFVMVTVTHSGTYLPQRKAYIMNSDITDTIRVVPDNGIYFEYPNVEATEMSMTSTRNGFSSSGVTYTGVATGLTNQSTATSFSSTSSPNMRSIATPSGSNIIRIYGSTSLTSVRGYSSVITLYFSEVTSEGVPIVNVLSWGSNNYNGGNRVKISTIGSGISGLFKGTGSTSTLQETYVGFVSDFAPTLTASDKSDLMWNMFSYGYKQPYLNCSALDTSGVNNMRNTFLATYINCTLENWDFSSVSFMSDFMGTHTAPNTVKYYGGFSSPDLYDRLLNAWIQYPERRPANPIAVNFGKSKYTSAGASARDQLVALGFTITDAGLA